MNSTFGRMRRNLLMLTRIVDFDTEQISSDILRESASRLTGSSIPVSMASTAPEDEPCGR